VAPAPVVLRVSPTSIRSRILKAQAYLIQAEGKRVSPTSIRSRILKVRQPHLLIPFRHRFTHVDPFEDTESNVRRLAPHLYRNVSPTSIRSRILKVAVVRIAAYDFPMFHPRRSVRGY